MDIKNFSDITLIDGVNKEADALDTLADLARDVPIEIESLIIDEMAANPSKTFNGFVDIDFIHGLLKTKYEHDQNFQQRIFDAGRKLSIKTNQPLNQSAIDQILVEKTYHVTAGMLWKYYKKVIRIDQNILNNIGSIEGGVKDLPLHNLKRLPYPSFFIDFRHIEVRSFHKDLQGFLVTISSAGKDNDEDFGLLFTPISETNSLFFLNVGIGHDGKIKSSSVTEGVLSNIFPILFYLVSDASKLPAPSYKSPRIVKTRRQGFKIFPAKAITTVDVGVEQGAKIAEAYSRATKTGGKKSPHIRRAHWHRFWVGKRNSDERRLKLNWIAPTFVDPNYDE